MGKSVMLAYVLFVLSCDYYVEADDGTGARRLVSFAEKASELGIAPHAQRSITAYGMSHKQVSVLDNLWRHFQQLFGTLENGHLLHFHHPAFRIWDAKIPDECNILVVDEAHDLMREAHGIIAGWKNDEPERRYLLVACDRHQRLRLAGRAATIIEGLNFRSHTLRMRRNYRSPFPVYAGSLALMFRWFAESGPKIIPSLEEFREAFGFNVDTHNEHGWTLSNINDSHPGNHWCYTVSRFLSAQDALRQVQSLHRTDVLWVRFCEEELFFDYEQLAAFTYHPMQGDGSAGIIDKYIKGQEFSVVVIEGMPRAAFAEPRGDAGQDLADDEMLMWQARRELFLCASRANVFLFFVLRDGAPGEGEVETLLGELRKPHDSQRRVWRLRFTDGQPARQLSVIDHFDEEAQPTPEQQQAPAVATLRLTRPIMIRTLVHSLMQARGLSIGVAIDQVLDAASRVNLDATRMDSLVPDERLRDFEQWLGVVIELAQPEAAPPSQPAGETAVEVPPELLGAPPGLLPGVSVRQAAAILRVPPQRVLDLLPVTYVVGQTINSLADVLRLRPLWDSPATTPQAVSASPKPAQFQNPLAAQLWQRMQQRDFTTETRMVMKYVIVLTELLRQAPNKSVALLHYRPRSRRYFGMSEAEILGESPYASVYRLGASGLWAMCTLSNESKLRVLRDVLSDLPPGDVNRLLGGF